MSGQSPRNGHLKWTIMELDSGLEKLIVGG